MRHLFTVVALIGSLAFAQPAGASSHSLNADQIERLFTGTTIRTKSVRTGAPFFIGFMPGGTLRGRVERNGRVFKDEGRWWTTRNRLLCYKFERFGGAKRRCLSIELDGDEIARFSGRTGKRITSSKWTIETAGPRVTTVARAGQGGMRMALPPRPAPAALDREAPTIDVPERVSATGAVAEFVVRIRDASQIVEVTVNARPVTIDADGTLRVRRGVPQGRSTIVVAALDEWGNRAARRISVTRKVLAAIAPEATSAPVDTFSDIYFGKYHALVIGNNKYREMTPLKTAEDDAKAVARVLREEYGFDVRVLLNATRADMIGALSKLRARLTSDDNLLIYYAGHGELDSIAEQGYWLPVDAEVDVPTNWVSTGDITVMVRAIRAKHIMVVADSCYSGTLVRAAQTNIKTASARRAWLERMSAKRSRTALVSGGLEPVLDGGGGKHSVFAKAFLDALSENRGVLDGQALFDAIKRPVVVNSDQTPRYSDIRRAGHDGGDFLFVRR